MDTPCNTNTTGVAKILLTIYSFLQIRLSGTDSHLKAFEIPLAVAEAKTTPSSFISPFCIGPIN